MIANAIRFPITTISTRFRNTSFWKIMELEEEKEKEAKDKEFTYQNLITKNPKIETPNIHYWQTSNNLNSKLINQGNLSPIIIINQPPIVLILEPILLQPLQQPIQPPLQQPQQPLQQPQPQQLNLDPMAYTSIVKLEKFTGKEDDAQIWLNDIEKAITVNRWNDARALQAIPYFLQDTANS
ncbi:hypothetical protein G9A89_015758 [Geosiphon pyriformis]|nr:hypothetical protein G9A89_015758 [Geosiphon pyriformis]